MNDSHIAEPARQTPVVFEADLCIAGGSCTGVFAAVRAARLGLKVALIEQNTLFGGMAVAAQVNTWNNTFDTQGETRIIGGLTIEVMERLTQRGAVQKLPAGKRVEFIFNSAELAAELDALVTEHKIRPFLSTRVVAASRTGNRIEAAVVEDKSGRRAIRAHQFIDASGDGDLIRRAGFAAYKPGVLQAVNMQALISGFDTINIDYAQAVKERAESYNYPRVNNALWPMAWPGVEGLRNVFGPRLNGVDASDAEQLTETLIEGRRQHRAFIDMVREAGGPQLHIAAWPHALGVRETWHAHCLHPLTADELLRGEMFPDAIASGTYPVDVHSPEGTLLRYLDGTESFVGADGIQRMSRWRDESTPTPRCYHIPYRSLVPREAENVLVAGRVLDADREAFGGVRVMVNMNQTGEAAGVASALALRSGVNVAQVEAGVLRAELAAGGSLVLPE
jgi:2-polyprenyl-6-methoxyphenol hydroxylase-like FAD-dependent oxidoreductase